jgi:aryl-alcohol dehydrogenase-like predicted oxidoreductase
LWSPLASGFLSGKYDRAALSNPDNRYSGFDILPFDKERGFQLVEQMRSIAERHGVSVAQVALAWLLTKDAVTSILMGATKLPNSQTICARPILR